MNTHLVGSWAPGETTDESVAEATDEAASPHVRDGVPASGEGRGCSYFLRGWNLHFRRSGEVPTREKLHQDLGEILDGYGVEFVGVASVDKYGHSSCDQKGSWGLVACTLELRLQGVRFSTLRRSLARGSSRVVLFLQVARGTCPGGASE